MKYLVKNEQIIREISSIPPKFIRENGERFYGGYQNRIDLHYEDGWRNEVKPEYNPLTHYLFDKYYDIVNEIVTYTVKKLILPNIEDAKLNKIEELKHELKLLYAIIEPYLTELQIHDEVIPTGAKTKFKQIRTNYSNIVNIINGLTTVEEVLEYQLPYTAINNLRAQIEAFI